MEITQTPLKDRISQFASIIGAFALVLAIIGWVWQGNFTDIIGVLLAVGVAGVLVWLVLAPQEALALFTGRQARYSTVSVFLTLALLAGVVVVYLALQRSAYVIDMTERQDFTLDKTTTDVLDRLNRSIQITGFYSPSGLQMREIDDQIFRLYEDYTGGLIKRVYIDPQEQPALAQSFGTQFDGDVFISYLTNDGQVDFSSLSPLYRATNTERDLTTAIARLAVAGQFKVYFEIGYSNLDALNDNQQGLTGILNGLNQNGIRVDALNLYEMSLTQALIPEDADTVVLTRGNTDLSPASLAILDEYLKRGGALFILTDMVNTEAPLLRENGQFNQYLWQNYGIRALDAVVVDAIASGNTQLDVSSYAVFPDLEIGSRLNEDESTTTLFRVIRAIEVNLEPPVTNGQIIASSPQSYGETDLERLSRTGEYEWSTEEDLAGPFALMAWARDQNTGAKIILVGDTDFITNGHVGSPLGNSILFTDAIGWLTGFSDQVSFAPQAFVTGLPLVFIAPSTLDQIAFLTVVVMPGVVLLIGGIVWFRRRRH